MSLGHCACQTAPKKTPVVIPKLVSSGYSKKTSNYFKAADSSGSGYSKKSEPIVDDKIHTPEVEVLPDENEETFDGVITAGIGFGVFLLVAAIIKEKKKKAVPAL